MRLGHAVPIMVLASMAVTLLAAEPTKKKVNLLEKRRQSIARRAEMVRQAGGLVDMPATGLVFRVVNMQNRVPREAVVAHAREIENRMQFAVAVVGAEDEGAAQARLELVDDPALPSLLIAPDESWARLNVAWIAADNPTGAKISERLRKQMWRATAYALGAGNSMYGPCLMQPIHTLEDLDADTARTICPEPYGKIIKVAEKIGLQPRVRVTYQKACEEGWAPAPTNDLQKAIWEQARADRERGPANALKIEPPKKK